MPVLEPTHLPWLAMLKLLIILINNWISDTLDHIAPLAVQAPRRQRASAAWCNEDLARLK